MAHWKKLTFSASSKVMFIRSDYYFRFASNFVATHYRWSNCSFIFWSRWPFFIWLFLFLYLVLKFIMNIIRQPRYRWYDHDGVDSLHGFDIKLKLPTPFPLFDSILNCNPNPELCVHRTTNRPYNELKVLVHKLF